MKASKSCLEAIKVFEGFRAEAYKCPAGVWTIGYGHTKGVKAGQTITPCQAEELLLQDLLPCEKFVCSLKMPPTQSQFDALIDFAFNLGTEALRTSTLLRIIQATPSSPSIRTEFMRWVHADGKVLPGLVKRRDWDAKRYFGEV